MGMGRRERKREGYNPHGKRGTQLAKEECVTRAIEPIVSPPPTPQPSVPRRRTGTLTLTQIKNEGRKSYLDGMEQKQAEFSLHSGPEEAEGKECWKAEKGPST